MAEKKCVKCGKAYDENSGEWYECSDCDAVYCPECVEELKEEQRQRMRRSDAERNRHKKEKERMEKIPNADLDTYKRLICPRCEMEITPL